RDRSTTDDAATLVHARQAGLEDFAPDIVEIDVDAVGRGGRERRVDRPGLVVDCRVEAELAYQPIAFRRASGDADYTTAFDLAYLTDQRSHGSGSGGDDQGLA